MEYMKSMQKGPGDPHSSQSDPNKDTVENLDESQTPLPAPTSDPNPGSHPEGEQSSTVDSAK